MRDCQTLHLDTN